MSHSQLQVPVGQHGHVSNVSSSGLPQSQGFGTPPQRVPSPFGDQIIIPPPESPFGYDLDKARVGLPNIYLLLPSTSEARAVYNKWYDCIKQLLEENDDLREKVNEMKTSSPLPSDESKNLAKIAKQKATIKKLNSIIALLLNSESDEE